MRKLSSLSAILLLAAPFSATRAGAEALPGLSSYFAREILAVNSAVCSESAAPGASSQAYMNLEDINVDISPSVSFGISSVLSVSVAPEIDLVFVPSP